LICAALEAGLPEKKASRIILRVITHKVSRISVEAKDRVCSAIAEKTDFLSTAAKNEENQLDPPRWGDGLRRWGKAKP